MFDNQLKLIKENKREVFNSKDFEKILKEELEKIEEKIEFVGHRVVHGGEKFREAIKIDERKIKEMESFNKLAPLHNPFNILGIKIARRIFKKAIQVAFFDTAFYKDLPPVSYTYPLPDKVRRKYQFRRYGFHGISHEYASRKASQEIKKPFKTLKIISCHLGGGVSITAIKNGKVIDTSMGFIPLEGLPMMTRSGDIDPGIILEMVREMPLIKVKDILNSQSGIKGISGSGEMLEVLDRVKNKDKDSKLALDIFVYRIKKYIGAYFAILGGCDLLVFTGTIAKSLKIRKMISNDLPFLKKIVVVKTDEELFMAEKIK